MSLTLQSLKGSLLPCSISFLMGANPFQKCSFWWCRLFLVSEEQLQLPCQIPQSSEGPVHRLRGPLVPLETLFSTSVKVGAHSPLNSNEHSPRQHQGDNENSILFNTGIHLHTSTYQPLPWPHTPQTPAGTPFKDNLYPFFNSLVNKPLLGQGIQFSFQGRPWSPQ